MPMPRHLLVYFALVLAVLLPMESAYAVNGCGSAVAMDTHERECGDCTDGNRQQCQAYCIALCQTFPASRVEEVGARARATVDHELHEAAFPRILCGGPEPPPPRTPR